MSDRVPRETSDEAPASKPDKGSGDAGAQDDVAVSVEGEVSLDFDIGDEADAPHSDPPPDLGRRPSKSAPAEDVDTVSGEATAAENGTAKAADADDKPSKKPPSSKGKGRPSALAALRKGTPSKGTPLQAAAANAAKKRADDDASADEADAPAAKDVASEKAAPGKTAPGKSSAGKTDDDAKRATSSAEKPQAEEADKPEHDEGTADDDDPDEASPPPSSSLGPAPDPEDEPEETDDEPEDEDEEEPEPTGRVEVRYFGRTDVGQVREHNEDNFIVADLTRHLRGEVDTGAPHVLGERGALFGVCDGMGGAAAGEVASQLAVDIVYEKMTAGEPAHDRDELASRLVNAVESAGIRIFSEAKMDRTRRGMGTTATVAAMMDEYLFLGQVGDSRGYILRGDRLVQVTRDQSLVNQLIEAGQLTEEEAETFEHNNIILQALGTADTVQVDLTFVELRRGDTLLLCSDGLSGMVRNDEIGEVLRSIDDPLEACRELTDRANQAGGHDNVTVVVAKFDGEGLPEPTLEEIEELAYQKYDLPESSGHSLPPSDADWEPPLRSSRRPPSRPPGFRSPASLDPGSPDYDYADDFHPTHEPIDLPTERVPSWLVTMIIVSAITCIAIAGYFLLR